MHWPGDPMPHVLTPSYSPVQGMLIVTAEKAFGLPPAFLPNPPNALPYTALAFEKGKLVLRTEAVGAPSGDALGIAADAAAAESPRSAAQAGAVVTDSEAAAALGAEEEGSSGDEAVGDALQQQRRQGAV